MEMFKEIMTLAQRDDERRLALDILKQIRTTGSLATAVGYLDQPKLCDAAAGVAVTMSEKMLASKPAEVAAAMQQVIRLAKNKEVVEKARGILNRTGKNQSSKLWSSIGQRPEHSPMKHATTVQRIVSTA